MASDRIVVPYNHQLKRLEALLAGVERAGDFFVQGALDAPIPRVEIDGVGMLSFPVPPSQIEAVIKRAHRAPYGRGTHTIVDTSVRNAWQLDSADVRIGGKAWEKTFHQIMSAVTAGLGCSGLNVSATLYKLLVYETGGLFRAHRDTEKTDGIFGTLVVVLPSSHGGGELIIRHGTREVSVNLSSPDVSELRFAAFYADCEHEVRPITGGSRVCLTYSLSLAEKGKKKQQAALAAPLDEREVAAAADMLRGAFRQGRASMKLAWLLEHQYSAAGLSFAGLKGQDAARVQVLSQAAERADCSAHLGIVHIEETGPAEPHFDVYDYRGRRSEWHDDDPSDEEEDVDEAQEAVADDDFDVIEVSDAWHYVDHWVDTQNRSVDFGKVPVKENELLPAGALDHAAPDRQRLTEATGNEGASFERSYRRAALVIWPRRHSADVLLEGGVRAVMPYLQDIVQRCSLPSASRSERATAHSTAGRIIRAWKRELADPYGLRHGEEPSRSDMVTALGQLADAALLESFVTDIVVRKYDGSENEALAARAALLGARKAGELVSALARAHVPSRRGDCVDLLSRLVREHDHAINAPWRSGLRQIAAAIIAALPKRQKRSSASDLDDGLEGSHDSRRSTEADAEMVVTFLDNLASIDAPDLRCGACDAVLAAHSFDSARVIVSALSLVHARDGKPISGDADYEHLWHHAATMLLARSEHPPEVPQDWRQEGRIRCTCDDCRELQTFVRDPLERTHRFPLRKDRRRHLHEQIQRHDLDMTHETERRGSPQTLVCTKTRRAYERQCAEHKIDVAAMATLLRLIDGARGELATLAARIAHATRSELESR
jgi:predicted 2-oxoglutarate/Fe(II)-dependent dioxygenase YbiX